MSNRVRKTGDVNIAEKIIDELFKKTAQDNERKKRIFSNADYVDKLVQYLKENEYMNSSNKEPEFIYLSSDLDMFFAGISEYAKKYFVKNYCYLEEDFDEIYYIKHQSVVFGIKHTYVCDGGGILVERFNETTNQIDLEIIDFSDIILDKVPEALSKRVEKKKAFEKQFSMFFNFIKEEGFSDDEILNYLNSLVL